MSQQVRFAPTSFDAVYLRHGYITVLHSDGDETLIAVGHHPAWFDAGQVAYCPPEEGVVQIHDLVTGETWGLLTVPAGNTLTAAASKVAVHRIPAEVFTSWGIRLFGSTDPQISADGQWMATLLPDIPNPGGCSLTVHRWDYAGVREYRYIGHAQRPRFSNSGTTLVWEDAGAIYGIADVANPQSPVVRLSRPGDACSHPVPLWVPDVGLFVLYVQDHGEVGEVQLAEWSSAAAGAPLGYRYQTSSGSGYDHDICTNTGRQIDTSGEDACIALLEPDGTLVRWAVFLDDPRQPLPLPPAPPVVEPPDPDPDRWSFVPDGTLVTDAFRAMFGAAPCLSPDGKRICLHKNINEQEWRELLTATNGVRYAAHLFDRSRYPGDVGWYLYSPTKVPTWAKDTFHSGEVLRFDGDGEIVEMSNGHRNRWQHVVTLFGLKDGGTCHQFDPRFPHQDYGPEKCYERMFNRLDGGVRWELWYSPEAARSLPWGDRSLDVLKQAVEDQAQPGAPTPAYIECPRLSVSDDPWAQPKPPKPPAGDDMTADDIRRYIGALDDPLVFGALQRFHNEVLPRDRPEGQRHPVRRRQSGHVDRRRRDRRGERLLRARLRQ
jgi:hypothetical protein